MPSPTPLERVTRWMRRGFFWLPSSTTQNEQQPESLHDHHLVIAVTAPERIPRLRQLRYALRIFSPAERRILYGAMLIAILALGIAGSASTQGHLVSVPVAGGSVTEALIGQPKYINPLDASMNDVDADLSGLLYSGLFHLQGLDVSPDLAEEYHWSDDRKTLTVKLRSDARFHDGERVTSQDVRYTFDNLQDPARKSPLAPLYHGVTITADDASTIHFTLDKPDAMFLSKLAIGILPAHLWQEVPNANARLSDLNIKPIGSGPYRVKSFLRDSVGNIHSFTLERFEPYYGVKPYLTTLIFQFYPDRQSALDAFKSDLVESIAFINANDAAKISSSARAHNIKLQLPEETIAFFNIKDKTLALKDVREALSLAADRADISAALQNDSEAVTGPYPFGIVSSTQPNLARARELLTNSGWIVPQNGNIRIWSPPKKVTVVDKTPNSKNKKVTNTDTLASAATTTLATPSSTELALTINVPNEPDLLAIADILKREWSLLGARVTVEPLATDELMRHATRDRNTQIVLLNIFLGPEQDLFPFWWSGQAVDRGLNFSSLTDRNVDNALQATRDATTTESLITARENVANAINQLYPAVFLIRPTHHNLVSATIKGVTNNLNVSTPSDRLLDMLNWYTKTGWRWK